MPSTDTVTDLRSWIATLEAADQLKRISTRVDWDEEIGAVTRANMALRGPALIFENIRDHTDTLCTQLMTCGLSTRERVALMAGLSPDISDKDLVRHFKDRYRNPLPPVAVDSGPVKANVLRDNQIDLGQFPAPRWYGADGGRYIDTYCGVVTHDPETDRANVGLYRGMIAGRNKIAKLMLPTQGWGGHFGKHRNAGGKMPVAIVHGWHDVMPFCAGSPFPRRICEWDMMGAILGKPVELVQCETVDLQVPANAEFVIEGYIDPDPDTFVMEGPFADYPGHEGATPTPKPVLQIECITHRENPIMRGALEGARPGFPSEDSGLCAYSWSAIAWNMLEDAGVDGILDVWMPPVVTGMNIVVQIQKRYHGHAQQIANTLWGTSAGQWFFKNVMVVEEDIDIRDWEAREWAMAFRVNASENGVLTFGPTFGSPLDPSTRHEYSNIRKYGTARWTRVLIDATRNWTFEPNPDWGGRRMSPIASMDPELERKIAARWDEYGIGSDYLDDDMRERLTLEELRKRFPDV